MKISFGSIGATKITVRRFGAGFFPLPRAGLKPCATRACAWIAPCAVAAVLWLNGVRDSGMSDYERHQWVLKDTRGLNRVKVL